MHLRLYKHFTVHNPHNVIEVTLQLKLVFGLQYPEGKSLAQFYLMKLLTLRLVFEPFVNQLHDVELTNNFFLQNSATAHTTRTTINYLDR